MIDVFKAGSSQLPLGANCARTVDVRFLALWHNHVERGSGLVSETEENLGALTVDPMRLRQILLNLLRLSDACNNRGD